jgi:molecular chaperone HtpG
VLRALHVPVASGNRYAVLPFLRAWVEARGGQLAELGTGSGDAALFKREPLDADSTKWLEEALAGPGEEVVPARFDPAGLPLAVVPDREAAVKARIEDDDAARRIASGVLALARLRTAAISDRRVAHLYVNLGNPAVERLLELRPDRDHSAVRLLRALKQLGGGGGGDLAPALSDATATVVELLAGLPPPPPGRAGTEA